jgi:hypothetical protein
VPVAGGRPWQEAALVGLGVGEGDGDALGWGDAVGDPAAVGAVGEPLPLPPPPQEGRERTSPRATRNREVLMRGAV